MSTEKINLIVQSFQQMNLSLLDVLLPNKGIYNETTKQIFLEKIEEMFKIFKRYNCTFPWVVSSRHNIEPKRVQIIRSLKIK